LIPLPRISIKGGIDRSFTRSERSGTIPGMSADRAVLREILCQKVVDRFHVC
jgi:hypothetical protein